MQPLAFQPVLPASGEPAPLRRQADGWYLRVRAPRAEQITLEWADRTSCFVKTAEKGLFEIRLPFDSAVNYIQIRVDGLLFIDPRLPIAYGYGRPCNVIELPQKTDSFWEIRDVPHGEIRQSFFFSEAAGEWERCMIYTPPEYDRNPDRLYPVLYLQHGHGENETGWTALGRVNFILDNLIAEGRVRPFVVVMNNGMVQEVRGGARRVDHVLFEEMLLREAIPFIEGKEHCGRSKHCRGIAGLSMGSMQTSRIALRHPEMFSEVGLFSGFLRDWIEGNPEMDSVPRPRSGQRHLAALDDPRFSSCFRTFFRGIGDRDPFLRYFLEDEQIREEKGIHCTRKIYPGLHDWNVWRECIYDFSQMIFK